MKLTIVADLTISDSSQSEAQFPVPSVLAVNVDDLRSAMTLALLAAKLTFTDSDGMLLDSTFFSENVKGKDSMKLVRLTKFMSLKSEVQKSAEEIGIGYYDFLYYGYFLLGMMRAENLWVERNDELYQVFES